MGKKVSDWKDLKAGSLYEIRTGMFFSFTTSDPNILGNLSKPKTFHCIYIGVCTEIDFVNDEEAVKQNPEYFIKFLFGTHIILIHKTHFNSKKVPILCEELQGK